MSERGRRRTEHGSVRRDRTGRAGPAGGSGAGDLGLNDPGADDSGRSAEPGDPGTEPGDPGTEPGDSGAEPGDSGAGDSGAARGARLGLPVSGPGSLATAGPRIGAFAVDAVLSTLVAGLFTAPALPRTWSLLAFCCEYVFFAATFGQTPGMAVLRLGLVRVDGPGRVGLGRAALRTLLLMLLVPAVIFDSDGRGMHDRLTGTAVVRLR